MKLLRRVSLKNYKSIEACAIDLQSLTFLVGPNGAGKSNFLDALRFLADSLNTSLDHALRERGGIAEVQRRSGYGGAVSIKIEFDLRNGGHGFYAVRIARKDKVFEVEREECRIRMAGGILGEVHFRVENGVVKSSSAPVTPPALVDRLFLVAAAGLPEFRPVYDMLSRISVYNINPQAIAAMQKPDAGVLLRREGANAASVLSKVSPSAREMLNEYLSKIIPGLSGVEPRLIGMQETLEFSQKAQRQDYNWKFLAASMSDGTLRALGILLALFQGLGKNGEAPPVIGLEEPEAALHPAAAGVLLSALREASKTSQIIVTSHSPDLLDDSSIPSESIYAVENQDGITLIGPLDEGGRSVLKDRLFTPGELLRLNQLSPDHSKAAEAKKIDNQSMFELE